MRLMLILRRRRRRGGEIVTPSTWHPQFLRSSERVGTGRMSESSQRVGTGRTPLALRNKETFVPGDLQCLNHRSCENVLLIPPPRVPPGPRSSPLSTTHGTKQSTKQFSSANGTNGTKHKPLFPFGPTQRTDRYTVTTIYRGRTLPNSVWASCRTRVR